MPLTLESPAFEEAVPPLTRPQLAEARRMRAAELFSQGDHSQAEIARWVAHEWPRINRGR